MQDKVYMCITASDTPSQDLTQYYSQCNDFIHKARLDGGSVLVHWWVCPWWCLWCRIDDEMIYWSRLKGVYTSRYGKPITELQSHVGSHSFTCHPT